MRFKGFGGLTLMLAVLACVLFAQAAPAAEGMGPHRGSFLFFPYWTTQSPFITVFRVTNATDLNDPTLPDEVRAPEGQEGPAYNNNPIQLHFFFLETPACNEFDTFVPFTRDDYRLLNVRNLVGGGASGWAYAYATLLLPPQSRQILLWDRFFSDTVVVHTADGWARGWANYQQWGKAGLAEPLNAIFDHNNIGVCDYTRDRTADFNINQQMGGQPVPTNDVCVFGPDNVGFNVTALGWGIGANYWPMVPPSNFFGTYFTNLFRFSGVRANDTEYAITPIAVPWQGPANAAPLGTVSASGPAVFGLPSQGGEYAVFRSSGSPDWDYDAIVYDPDENPFSVQDDTIICQEVRTIHELTGNVSASRGLTQGWVHYWGLCPPGNASAACAAPGGEFVEEGAASLQFDRFPSGRSTLAWGFWSTHDKTTVDDRELFITRTPPGEGGGGFATCSDGVDNDADGLTDTQDVECWATLEDYEPEFPTNIWP